MCDVKQAISAIGFGFGEFQKLEAGYAQGVAQIKSAAAASKQYNYEANIAELNATLAKEDARRVLEQGSKAISEIYSNATKVESLQVAQIADSGFVVGEGTAADITKNTAITAEIDAMIMKSNAKEKSWGFEVEALNQKSKAKMYRMAAKDTMDAGYINANSTLLGSTSQFAANTYDFFGGSSLFNTKSATGGTND